MLKLTNDGCKARREALLEKCGCDLLIIANPRHIQYLSGAYLTPPVLGNWGLNFLLIERTGKTTLIVHDFIAEFAVGAHVDELITWRWYDAATDSAGFLFEQALAELEKLLPAQRGSLRIGAEPGWNFGEGMVNLTPILEAMRRVKYPDELDLIRESLRVVEAGHAAARQAIRPGLTELDIYHVINAAIENEAGHAVQPHMFDYVSGPRTGNVGGPPTNRVLQRGDLMICDVFPIVNGYRGDSTITLSVDRHLTESQKLREQAVHEALAAAEAALKPGTRAAEVYRAARTVLDRYPKLGTFPHHAGHGLGLGHPEAVFFVPNSTEVLQVGEVVTLEPGIYQPEVEGARIEHNYLITETGCERLTHHVTSFA